MKLSEMIAQEGCGRAALVASGRFVRTSVVLDTFRRLDFRSAESAARWIQRSVGRWWYSGRLVVDSATTELYASLSAIVAQLRDVGRGRARGAARERVLRELHARELLTDEARRVELAALLAADPDDDEVVESQVFDDVPGGVSAGWAFA